MFGKGRASAQSTVAWVAAKVQYVLTMVLYSAHCSGAIA